MRLLKLLILFAAVLLGSGYWYSKIDYACKIPIHYRIGAVDARFGTDVEKLKAIASRAEAVWEAPLGKELFIYDEKGALPINLVFDERQANTDKETELRQDLAAKEGMSESVARQYEMLIEKYRKSKKEYESRVLTYDKKLTEYNDTVTEWNAKGGAPQEVVTALEATQKTLSKEKTELEELAKKLNNLAKQLNDIGAKGNSLITDYNTVVREYNERFSEEREFTQGEHTPDAINIYQFKEDEELTVVLAHEFGHALALGHVENERSIMYHLMKKQELDAGITMEDKIEFDTVCTEKRLSILFLRKVSELFQ